MSEVFELDPVRITELARRASGWLASRGLVAGDRVAVQTPNDPRLLALAHGALRTGIVPVFVNPGLHPPERAWILEDSEPSLVVEDLDAKWLVVGKADHSHRLRRSTAIKLARSAKCGVVVVR